MVDVVQELLNAKCLGHEHYSGGEPTFHCCATSSCPCQGTKLRWPTLSRFESQCASHHSYPERPYTERCVCSDRVPDVTIEKLMRLGIQIWFQPKGVIGKEDCFVAVHHEFDPTNPFTADTPEQAGCAALLATL